MKKVFMVLGFALSTIAVSAQLTKAEKDALRGKCKTGETWEQCQARVQREKNEMKIWEDSVARANKEYGDKRQRDLWEQEKAKRDSLSPEERRKQDEQNERSRQEEQQEKKVYKTGRSMIDWASIFAGLILATQPGTPPANTPAPGFKLGMQTQVINFSDYLRLGIGAEYSMQGGKYKSTDYITGGNYGTSSTTSRLNYLNFPILVHYQKQRNGFFAEAGVQPGLLLNAKNKGTTTTDIKDKLKKLDVGIPVGVGYNFKNKFGVGLRVTPGLLNINKDDKLKSHNLVASLSVSHSL